MSPAAPLELDSRRCDNCGACIAACTPKVLRIGPGYISVDWERCDACAKCAAVCDAGAIRQRGAAVAAGEKTGGGGAVASSTRAGTSASSEPRRKPTPARAAAPAAAPRWSLPEAALVAVVALALLVGGQSFVAATATPPWEGIALVTYDVALVALLWYLARRHGLDPSRAYRIDGAPDLSSMLLAPVVALGCWLFSLTYRAIVLAAGLAPAASEGADLTRLFGPGLLGVVLTVLTVAVLGPVLEELLMRGVVLEAVRGRYGTWAAILVSAFAFASLHASLWSLLPLTVLGIGLGWLAARSRSLWPAIVAHVIYNGVLVAAVLYTAAR